MDNIIKKAVEDGIEKYMKSEPKSKPSSPKKKREASPERQKEIKPRLENRLGKLLHRIRGNNSKQPSKKILKFKHIHVKWERYDYVKAVYKSVKLNEGGGHRFIQWGMDDPITFSEIKDKMISLYFDDNGRNNFHENKLDCVFDICDAAGSSLSPDENIWDYLKRKGLFLSKVCFVLHSKDNSFDYQTCNDPDQQAMDNSSNFNYDDANNVEICRKCFCTKPKGLECLRCEQNKEFRDSLNQDELKSNSSEIYLPSLGDLLCIDSTYAPLEPSIEELRIQRLNHFVSTSNPANNLNDTDISTADHFDTTSSINTVTYNIGSNTNNLASSTNSIITDPRRIILKVNRLKIKNDLINEFIEKKVEFGDIIIYTIINVHGEEEQGVGKGVSRDVYTMFWNDVADSYLVGAETRIPLLRHDLYVQEWNAIGKILVKGFKDTNFFPVILSPCFIIYCMFGETTEDELLNGFMRYLAKDERSVLEGALAPNEGAKEVICSDEFIDIMDQFHCRTSVNTQNVRSVIFELARQELIQKPHLMSSCWKPSLEILKKEYLPDKESVKSLYETLEPTNKKVIELFDANPMDDSEKDALQYLKRYVRGLESLDLKKLLQFMTGSSLITVEKISISFVKVVSEFQRRPIAHTCGPCLELPTS